MLLRCVLFACLIVGVFCDVTFNHVTVMGGSKPVNIISSNALVHYVPERTISHIYFNAKDLLPILYTDSFTDLLYLESLDLSDHGVKEIRRGAFNNLPVLSDLILDNNDLEEITSGVFNYLVNLTRLSLNKNSIKNVSSSAFDKLYNLSFLFLAGNQLHTFDPNWFQDKHYLFVVDLNENKIEEIPDAAFENYHNSIFLGGNEIQNLSREMFGKGKKLRQLSLHDNEIESWNEDFLDGVELSSFDISSNKIQCLDGNFSAIFAAKYTFLNNNPWNCTCLGEIVDFQKHEEIFRVNIDVGTSWLDCNVTESGSLEEK